MWWKTIFALLFRGRCPRCKTKTTVKCRV
jgi:hypothetical protein